MSEYTIFVFISVIIIVLVLLKILINGPLCRIDRNLKDVIVFITGANSGIGKATAIELAKKGATLILACRDVNKAKRVSDQIF